MLKFAQLATSVKSRYRAADAVTVVAASGQQERTLPRGQGRRSTYDGSIDAPAEAGDEIEGGWRREELLAMDIRRAPQARALYRTGAQSTTLIDVRLAPTSGAKADIS